MTSADVDIELQILQELKELEDRGYKIPPFHHVKAHQDKKFQYAELSRAAQLNVDADRLATAFPHSGYIKQAYHLPTATKASLYINSVAITSQYKECLRDELHTPALKEYIQKKWDWDDSTFDGIWWKAHGIALKRLSHSDSQKIQKFNYNHLPTNRRLSKFHQHISSLCPNCNAAEETDDHVIWCNHNPDKVIAKQLWESDVYHYLSAEHTPPMVRSAIMLGLHHWIYHKPIPPLVQCLPQAPTDIQQAYNAQTHIGWGHFIRGRLSILWKQIIADHLATIPREDTHEKGKKKKENKVSTSNDWAARLNTAVWHGVLILWDIRNRSIHGENQYSQSSGEKSRLLQEARSLLDVSKTFQDTYEIDWFKKPIEELEKYSVISLKAWIRNARMMVKVHQTEIRKTTNTLPTEEGDLFVVNSIASTGLSGGIDGVEHR